jgi:hypothetical protein
MAAQFLLQGTFGLFNADKGRSDPRLYRYAVFKANVRASHHNINKNNRLIS